MLNARGDNGREVDDVDVNQAKLATEQKWKSINNRRKNETPNKINNNNKKKKVWDKSREWKKGRMENNWRLTEDESPFVIAKDPSRVADGFVGVAASKTPQRITVGALDATHTHCTTLDNVQATPWSVLIFLFLFFFWQREKLSLFSGFPYLDDVDCYESRCAVAGGVNSYFFPSYSFRRLDRFSLLFELFTHWFFPLSLSLLLGRGFYLHSFLK